MSADKQHRMAKQSCMLATYLVRDYDDAILWFVEKLGFKLIEDTPLSDGKRWVVISSGDGGVSFLLAKADGAEQEAFIGKAVGGRVAFFLRTNNFDASYRQMKEAGVHFTEQPRYEAYGAVVVFLDLYGNKWDLIG